MIRYNLRSKSFMLQAYLIIFLINLLVALPAARRAILFPSVPFITACTLPKMRAKVYKNPRLCKDSKWLLPYQVHTLIITEEKSPYCQRFAHTFYKPLQTSSNRHIMMPCKKPDVTGFSYKWVVF